MNLEAVSVGRFQLLWVGASALVIALVALMTVPVIDEDWGGRPWFQGIYLTAVVLLDGQIALFLLLQVLAGAPTRALSWLAGGYAFVVCCAAGQFHTFPGLLVPEPGPSADQQANVTLWLLWHTGLPVFVLMALGTRLQGRPAARQAVGWKRAPDLLPVVLGVGVAVLAMQLMDRHAELLPDFVHDNDFSGLRASPWVGVMLTMNVLALLGIIHVTRLREVVYLWLALALFAFTIDALLTLWAGVRYSAGWYVGRTVSLVASASLMMGLMVEYYRLTRDAELRAAYHEQEAAHDSLTGLFNRRYLVDKLSEELGRGARYRYPVSLLLIDLDHFKRINDTRGHGVGDDCLRALAGEALARRVSRSGDFSARYGGEEFVVVMPETGTPGAVELAEDVRRTVQGLHAEGLSPCPMTVSIGVATATSAQPRTVDDLLASADRCLYRAKELGRNRVMWPDAPEVTRIGLAM